MHSKCALTLLTALLIVISHCTPLKLLCDLHCPQTMTSWVNANTVWIIQQVGQKKRRINNWQWQRQNKLSSKATKATLPITSRKGVTSHLSVTFWDGKTFYLNLINISPLSPSLEIFLRSRKCVPMATSFTLSESRIWIFMRVHSGGNISVKTICSFQIGS